MGEKIGLLSNSKAVDTQRRKFMEKKVYFEDARKSILEVFSDEFPTITINQIDMFTGMIYHLINYEEESKKIRPTIIITSNINSVVKYVPKAKKIVFYEDADFSNFKTRLKALMCFCTSDWFMYVNFGEEIIEYGIIKRLTSIKDRSLIQMLNDRATLDSIGKRNNLIVLNVLGGGVVRLIGAKGSNTSICFNLNSHYEYNWDNEINEFVEACVSKIKTTPRKLNDIKNLIGNIFHRVLRDLHGTICMVVDKEYKDKGFLQDGTWLKEPLEFGKMFLRSSNYDESILRSYADVLTNMLDFDGITVIDNAGRIRAYNVFIESSQSAQKKVVGGARKRAAYTILENKSKKIIGVYFQSQDGDNFYKEKSDLKKKKKIKIVGGEVITEDNKMLPLEIVAKLEQAKKKEEEKKSAEEKKKKDALAEKNKEETSSDKQKELSSTTQKKEETSVKNNKEEKTTETNKEALTENHLEENC